MGLNQYASTLVLVLATFVLGLALCVYNATSVYPVLADIALLPLTLSLMLCGIAVVGYVPGALRGVTERSFTRTLARCVALQTALQAFDLARVRTGLGGELPVFFCLAACAYLLYAGVNGHAWCQSWWFFAILALQVFLGVLVIRGTPDPHIDTLIFQHDSVAALLRGHNPYTLTFPDIYGSRVSYYPPGFVGGGRVLSGFPYPPLSLLFSLPGYLLGDCRYSQLAAISITALVLRAMGRSLLSALVALLFLTQPRIFSILQFSWTDPFVVLLLALGVYASLRSPKLLPWWLGLLLAIKQYMILAVPAILLLPPARLSKRGLLRPAGIAGLAAIVVTLPFLLWDPRAFVRSVFLFHVYSPFRADSLSYTAFLARRFDLALPSWLPFVALVAGIGVSIWKQKRSAASFSLAIAVGFLLFFPLSKQAFGNYYFFVAGALACAIASRIVVLRAPHPDGD